MKRSESLNKSSRVGGIIRRLAQACFAFSILLSKTVSAQPVFPLKISSDNHYLVDQVNIPFPILGRTAWFILSQSEEGYKKFIDNTVGRGYNSIEMHVLNHDPRGNHPPLNGNGNIPFLKCLSGSSWKGSLSYKSPLTTLSGVPVE